MHYFSLIFFICLNLFAHDPPADNVSELSSSLQMGFGESTGGYGYIPSYDIETELPTSEAANLYGPEYICRDNDSIINCYLSIRPLTPENASLTDDVINQTLNSIARQKSFEYNMLALSANKSFNQEMCSNIEGCTYNHLQALNNHFGDSSIDLSCLGGDFYSAMSEGAVIQVNEIETADGDYRYLNQNRARVSFSNSLRNVPPSYSFPVENINLKTSAIGDSLDLRMMSRIFVWYKHLENTKESIENDSSSSQGTLEKQKDIEFQMKRIQQSYPGLFPSDSNKQEEIHQKVFNHIYKAIHLRSLDFESSPPPSIVTDSDAIARGKEEFEALIADPFKFPEIINHLNNGLSNIDKGVDKNHPSANLYLQNFNELEKNIQDLVKQENLTRLKSICDRSFEDIAKESPQVIRQLLMDTQDPQTKQLINQKLCQLEEDTVNKYVKDHPCTSTGSDLSAGINVNFSKINYPYGSTNLNLLYQTNEQKELIITKNLRINAEGLTGDQKECLRNKITQGFNQDINCQIGSTEESELPVISNSSPFCQSGISPASFNRACPTPPNEKRDNKVRLNLNIYFEDEEVPEGTSISSSDQITIHECYKSDLPSDKNDCDAIKEFHQNKCIQNAGEYKEKNCQTNGVALEGAALEECCRQNIEEIFNTNPSTLMRENAANMTGNSLMGVWRHELLHQFGLNDEYSNRNYPFSPQGNYTSIMKKARHDHSVVEPHHIDTLVRRLQCTEE